jgi:arsenate reductase (glutaredoxin)
MQDVIIYHNPACGTSRNTLALIRHAGIEPQVIDHMLAHPILMNRPVVVTPIGVKLCRPSELVLDLLPQTAIDEFKKEDGEIVIDSKGQRAK